MYLVSLYRWRCSFLEGSLPWYVIGVRLQKGGVDVHFDEYLLPLEISKPYIPDLKYPLTIDNR